MVMDNAFLMIGFGLILIGLGIFLFKGFWSVLFSILGGITILFTLWFFRDPSRTIPQKALNDDTIILAPADGKIVQIIPVEEKDYLKSSATQISIFLSPLDVHVNRTPVTGIVEFYKYMPGDYLRGMDILKVLNLMNNRASECVHLKQKYYLNKLQVYWRDV
jgi:phosphatidylserine decarboxylase